MDDCQPELYILKESDEPRLLEDAILKVVESINNPLLGPATIVLLLIQPNQDPAVKSVNLEIPETKRGEKIGNCSFSAEEGEDIFCTQITIKIIREYSDGMISGDVLTI